MISNKDKQSINKQRVHVELDVWYILRAQSTFTTIHHSDNTYLLNGHRGDVSKGGFYEHEISKTTVGDVYLVEKVIQRKGDRVRVHWLGFGGKHDT